MPSHKLTTKSGSAVEKSASSLRHTKSGQWSGWFCDFFSNRQLRTSRQNINLFEKLMRSSSFFCVLFPCCNARPFPPGLSFWYLSYMLRWRHDNHMFLQVFSACVTRVRITVSQRPRHGLELLQETSRSAEVVGRPQVSDIMTDCNFINNVLITHPVLWTASNFKINELVSIYI